MRCNCVADLHPGARLRLALLTGGATWREEVNLCATTITITIGDKAFAATLSDNATATAFKKLLPLSITMTELNGNEKFVRLPGHYARSSVNARFHTDRRLDAVRFQHAGPVLQVVLNHVQLHEDRADRRPCRS